MKLSFIFLFYFCIYFLLPIQCRGKWENFYVFRGLGENVDEAHI